MKLSCKQSDLAKGLSIVSHAVSSRSTLPILANILLVTDQGRVKLSATNLELGITCWIDAEIHEEGTTTIPAKLFTDFVGSLPQAPVEIAVPEDTHIMSVKGLRSSATIKGMNPAEFPLIPEADGAEQPTTLDRALLKEMISQVAFAAATDDSRPVFTGISVEFGDERMTFAAADAFRLAVRGTSLPGDAQSHVPLLIPARTLTELARILPSEGEVQMIVTPTRSQVLFQTEQIVLVSRLLEGTFPNFRAIIPKESTTRAIIETKELAAAVKSVTPFARDSSNITRIKIESSESEGLEPGTLTLEATAEDVGSNVSTIEAAVRGPEQHIILNAKYLAEVLAVLGTPEVALEVTSPGRPAVIKPVGEIDFVHVIMPMSTNR